MKKTRTNLVVANNLAGILASLNTPESIARAMQILPDLENVQAPAVLDTVGWVQFRAGAPEKGVINLETAVRGAPDNGIVALHLGLVYAALDRKDEAKATLTRGLELLEKTGGYAALISESQEVLENM